MEDARLSTASSIARASTAVRASGFVQRMPLPARAAAWTASRCRWFGRPITTTSTSGAETASSRLVVHRGIPHFSAKALVFSGSRPWTTTTLSRLRLPWRLIV